jgi:hypothetical protein
MNTIWVFALRSTRGRFRAEGRILGRARRLKLRLE